MNCYDKTLIDKNNRENKQKNLSFIFSDINELDNLLPKENFNKIICMDVLEHMTDFKKTVKIFSDLLKEDGVFLATIPRVGHGHFEVKNDSDLLKILRACP